MIKLGITLTAIGVLIVIIFWGCAQVNVEIPEALAGGLGLIVTGLTIVEIKGKDGYGRG